MLLSGASGSVPGRRCINMTVSAIAVRIMFASQIPNHTGSLLVTAECSPVSASK